MRRVTMIVCALLVGNAVTAGDFCESTATEVEQVCERVNELRNREGRTPVKLSRHLNRVAEAYARDLQARGELTHGDFRARMDRAGIEQPAAENIAAGQKTPEDVVKAWTRSRGHFRNMTDTRYKSLGVGFHEGYWVQIFSAN